MDMDTLSVLITGALTILSPLAIARAKHAGWTDVVKVAVPVAVSVVLAVVWLWWSGNLTNVDDWPAAILAFYGLQQLAYTTIMRWWATSLEQAGQKDATTPPTQE